MKSEKQKVAFTSVLAAIFLTIIKIVVGSFTGSLGILSEAAHSALDLVAALVTLFAVKLSDKPADSDHNYGHGKIESFSALIETLLLLATCVWIIYEAMGRLFFGKSIVVSNTYWGIGIMILSIIINVSRAKALKKVAKKYGSQALEADALHFDSDVWSSYVVIGGLICVGLGDLFKIPLLSYGDPVAALGVSVLVIIVSVKLGKRTIDVLLDTAPKGLTEKILQQVESVKGILDVRDVRVRPSGARYFIDLNVGIGRHETHRVVHSIVDEIRQKLQQEIPNSDIVIGTFPVDIEGVGDGEVYIIVKNIVDRFPVCTNIHNIHIYEVGGKKNIALHLEIRENLSLKGSHDLSHSISEMLKEAIENVIDVSVNFEYVMQSSIQAEDITFSRQDLVQKIEGMFNCSDNGFDCHDIRLFGKDGGITVFLHCTLVEDYEIGKAEIIQKEISRVVRDKISNVDRIHIHMEPIGNQV